MPEHFIYLVGGDYLSVSMINQKQMNCLKLSCIGNFFCNKFPIPLSKYYSFSKCYSYFPLFIAMRFISLMRFITGVALACFYFIFLEDKSSPTTESPPVRGCSDIYLCIKLAILEKICTQLRKCYKQ